MTALQPEVVAPEPEATAPEPEAAATQTAVVKLPTKVWRPDEVREDLAEESYFQGLIDAHERAGQRKEQAVEEEDEMLLDTFEAPLAEKKRARDKAKEEAKERVSVAVHG